MNITPDAQEQFEALQLPIQARVLEVFARLEQWPTISGVKWLSGGYAGSARIRTGDFRVVFKVTTVQAKKQGNAIDYTVLVWKIGDRRDVYLD